jgi:integrase
MMYRHGLRVSEATAIKLADLNLQQARLWIRRLKNGLSVEHPLADDCVKAAYDMTGSLGISHALWAEACGPILPARPCDNVLPTAVLYERLCLFLEQDGPMARRVQEKGEETGIEIRPGISQYLKGRLVRKDCHFAKVIHCIVIYRKLD